ncbi:MAG: serine/threonine protein kinase [Candidatus Xenobiia bacterium LiM19]
MLTAGKTLNKRYTIESTLAQGGMSVLYLASDSHLPGRWVVKEMIDVFPNEEDRLAILDHFQKEVTILSMLNHQGLPKIIDYFESEGKRYLIEEFIQGITLHEQVTERIYTEEQAIDAGIRLLSILEYLHDNGIIYRDLKPQNILACPDGNYRIIDFGIARLYSIGKRRDTVLMGTPGFAAPEHYGNRQTDERSDIYSLGATLHHMVTGREPSLSPFCFEAPYILNSSVSRWFSDIVMTALEARPEDRFESAGEMREILTGPRGISVKAREYTYSPDHSYFFARRGIYYCSATILSALFFILSLPTESVPVIIIAIMLSTWTGRKYISYLDVFRNRFTTTPQELVITHPLHSIHIPWSSIVALRIRKYQSLIPRKKSNPDKQRAFTTIQIDSCDVLYRHDHTMGLPESQPAVPSYDFFDDPKSREEKGFRSLTFSSQLRDCEELFRTIVMRARLKSSEEPGSIYVDEVFFR